MGAAQVHVDQQFSPQDKIAIFRSLFRGREDVYPRHSESRKTGKSGYSPACASEWVRGICEKPRVKCAECHHRRSLLVTDDIIRWHLSGHDDADQPFVAGVYPMLQDESCFFLAIDFDKQDRVSPGRPTASGPQRTRGRTERTEHRFTGSGAQRRSRAGTEIPARSSSSTETRSPRRSMRWSCGRESGRPF